MHTLPRCRSRSAWFAVALTAICAVAKAAPTETAPVNEPPQLVTLRKEYEAALAPLQKKNEDALKLRATRYVTDLDKLAEQLTAASKLDSLEPIKEERNAYASGSGSSGFDEENKKVVPAARELRRTYERDTAKLRADHALPARPIAAKYAKQLAELEATMARERNTDGVLAVRHEKQAVIPVATTDPLYGGDAAILGTWYASSGKRVKISSDGKVSDSGGASARWEWQDRGRRKVLLHWHGARGTWSYTMTPDGGGMVGLTGKRERIALSRTEPARPQQ